jgi:hypothetical protein
LPDHRRPGGAGAHQQRPGTLRGVADEGNRVVAGIGQQQHRGIQAGQQPGGVAGLTGAFGTKPGGQQPAGAGLDQHHQPQQRIPEAAVDAAAFAVPRPGVAMVGHPHRGPSTITTRKPRHHTPGFPGRPTGTASVSNSARSGAGPTRCRAHTSAAIARGTYGDWRPGRAERERLAEIFPAGVCRY